MSQHQLRQFQIARTLLVPFTLVALLVFNTQDTIFDQIHGKTQQLKGLNGQITGTQNQLVALAAEDAALHQQIGALSVQLAQTAQQIQVETDKLSALQAQLDAIRAQLAAKEAVLAQHIAELGANMRLMYKTGAVSPLDLILSAGNFNDLLNRVFFFDDIVRENRRQVNELQVERDAIAGLKVEADAKVAAQAQEVQAVKAQEQQLQTERAQQTAAAAQVIVLEAKMQQYLQEEQAQRAALQAELRVMILQSLSAPSSGHFDWPLSGAITQGFGCTDLITEPYDPNCASGHFHTGIDIAAYTGTPVMASDGGIVHNLTMTCSWGYCGFGRYIVMVHAGGFISLYGHLSRWGLPDGSVVPQGTVIGYVGSTGNSTGPHLHFEIDLNGTPVNPFNYLP